MCVCVCVCFTIRTEIPTYNKTVPTLATVLILYWLSLQYKIQHQTFGLRLAILTHCFSVSAPDLILGPFHHVTSDLNPSLCSRSSRYY